MGSADPRARPCPWLQGQEQQSHPWLCPCPWLWVAGRGAVGQAWTCPAGVFEPGGVGEPRAGWAGGVPAEQGSEGGGGSWQCVCPGPECWWSCLCLRPRLSCCLWAPRLCAGGRLQLRLLPGEEGNLSCRLVSCAREFNISSSSRAASICCGRAAEYSLPTRRPTVPSRPGGFQLWCEFWGLRRGQGGQGTDPALALDWH